MSKNQTSIVMIEPVNKELRQIVENIMTSLAPGSF